MQEKEFVPLRIWIKFSKDGLLRFLSHLDLLRLWQRALRRAGLPVAYSRGFNPHPRLSFASALPVGIASRAEYADLEFREEISAGDIERLKSALPSGIDIVRWRRVPARAPSLMSLVRACLWTVPLPAGDLNRHLERLQLSDELPVRRKTKKGEKIIDIKPHIYSLEADGKGKRLEMLLACGSEGSAKPVEVLALLPLQWDTAGLLRTEILLAAGDCLQAPMHVLLKEKEVSLNAEEDYYQLRK